jgi:cob(I)alamin adenosyltransferase
MSIVTKTGDSGATGLMYNRRVPKSHPQVEAYGAVDELSAALGLARASTKDDFIGLHLLNIQKDLVIVMGELATSVEDLPRYQKDGYSLVTSDLTARLETVVKELEAQQPPIKGWATPGATLNAAALDLARTTCRRAERRVCALQGSPHSHNPEIVIYLNRLSDLLWLLARRAEREAC